ncbi:MAG TPA: hypothetical protein VFM05_05250 [Candidatus Saccharimonadales bacterium]|nr:hypothetical protein [Candidatus Saccharimonadales bacterium]
MKGLALLVIICNFCFSACGRSADLTTNSSNSSTPDVTDQKQTAGMIPEPSPPRSPTEHKQPSTKFRNHRVFAARLQKIDLLHLFEGLPHQMFALQLHEQELRTKKTVSFHGFPFYEETLELKEADAAELTLFFRDSKSFKPYWGPKACGGFHPDYCLEWHVGKEIYQALVCYGCHEVMFYGPDVELYCDIGDKAWGQLWKLLEPYNKNRPGPRLH